MPQPLHSRNFQKLKLKNQPNLKATSITKQKIECWLCTYIPRNRERRVAELWYGEDGAGFDPNAKKKTWEVRAQMGGVGEEEEEEMKTKKWSWRLRI